MYSLKKKKNIGTFFFLAPWPWVERLISWFPVNYDLLAWFQVKESFFCANVPQILGFYLILGFQGDSSEEGLWCYPELAVEPHAFSFRKSQLSVLVSATNFAVPWNSVDFSLDRPQASDHWSEVSRSHEYIQEYIYSCKLHISLILQTSPSFPISLTIHTTTTQIF